MVSNLKSELQMSQKSNLNEDSMHSECNECQRLTNELENVRKEQEDLLVLLTDQDSKLRHYKKRLKDLGQSVRLYLINVCVGYTFLNIPVVVKD